MPDLLEIARLAQCDVRTVILALNGTPQQRRSPARARAIRELQRAGLLANPSPVMAIVTAPPVMA